MVKRAKRLIKRIEGLRIQEEKHQEKLESEKGRKDTTFDYWGKEILQFQKQRRILEKKLSELREKRRGS